MTERTEQGSGETPAAMAQRWIAELGVSDKHQRKWSARAKKIISRYKNDRADNDTKRRFSILWANTQTIQPAIYSRPPTPVVSRRFDDADPVGRAASEVLERALSFHVDKQDLDAVLRLTSQDYCLIARAQVWERYVPTHGEAVTPKLPVLQVSSDAGVCYRDEEGREYAEDAVTETGAGQFEADGDPYDPVVYEESVTDYVNWDDFGFGPARTWAEVPYVWRRVYMDRRELVDRFGAKVGAAIPLDWGAKGADEAQNELVNKAAIYEIWDKRTRCAIWISKGYPLAPADHREDPLGLDGFFPCPRPLMGTLAPDSLNPVPDYLYYQDQAEEIDALTTRIGQLQDAMKVKGFYAGDTDEDLNNLLNANNNTLIPVASWRGMKEDGGLRGKIEWFPLDQIVSTLKACIELRQQLISDVYQITGVSDIQRGESDPRETYGAQAIKANFGSLRVRDRQNEVVRFARDILRIKGEVIAEHFSIETLKAMTGVKLPMAADKQAAELQLQQLQLKAQAMAAQAQQAGQPPPPPPEPPGKLLEVMQSPTWEDVKGLLENNAARLFQIDIETDSTIEPNESEEKARMVEFVQALGGFFGQIGPLVAQAPETAPMFAEIVKATVRRFRAGRELETVIDATMDKVSGKSAQAAQAPPAPPPDKTPVEVAQVNLQREALKQDGETQRAQLAQQAEEQALQLKAADQQIKVIALQRDPNPQVGA